MEALVMFSASFRCKRCSFDFTIDHKDFRIGPFAPTESETNERGESVDRCTRTLHCSQCALVLEIPKLLQRVDWIFWRDRSQRRHFGYPFVEDLITRIDATFAGHPWRVDIGEIACPYCANPLREGKFQPVCLRCQSRDLEHTNQCFSQIAGLWPPVA
jgi:hypothetical protein